MLSQVYTGYLKNNHINLDHHDVINVKNITFEGHTKDGNITTLKCDPTVDRLIQFPDANITVNKSEDLSGTTLSSNVINSSLQNLGSQNADLDMNGNNIINVGNIQIDYEPVFNSIEMNGDIDMQTHKIKNVFRLTTTEQGTVEAKTIYTDNIAEFSSDTGVSIMNGNGFYNNHVQFQSLRIEGNTLSSDDMTATVNIPKLTIASKNVATEEYVSTVLGDGTLSATFNDVAITGNLDVNGTVSTIDTQTVAIENNIILINSNQTGTPSNLLVGGLEIERGDLTNYQFAFRENDDSFCVGMVNDLQCVATRENTPIDTALAVWESASNKFITSDTHKTSTICTLTGSQTLTNKTLTSPSIEKIGNLTTNGFVKTSSDNGTLNVDTTLLTTYESIYTGPNLFYNSTNPVSCGVSLTLPAGTYFSSYSGPFGTVNTNIHSFFLSTGILGTDSAHDIINLYRVQKTTTFFNLSSSGGRVSISWSGLLSPVSTTTYHLYSVTNTTDVNTMFNTSANSATHDPDGSISFTAVRIR